MPRLRISHTGASTAWQIYIPLIDWGLMVMVILLVLSFRDSSSLTSAYGIAVTGATLIDPVLLTVLIFRLWKWHPLWAVLLLSIFSIVDGAYFAANMTNIPDGAWFPRLVTGRASWRERWGWLV